MGEAVLGWAAGKTFDNADNELYVYWTRTQPEHQEIILAGFDEDSEDNLNGFFDTSKVEVLERSARARREEARKEVEGGLRSPWSYAVMANLTDQMEETPHTRALYIPSGKTPLPAFSADAEALGLGTVEETPPEGAGELPPGEEEPAALPPGPTGADVPEGTDPAALGSAPTPAALPPGVSAAARRGAAAAALAAVAGTG